MSDPTGNSSTTFEPARCTVCRKGFTNYQNLARHHSNSPRCWSASLSDPQQPVPDHGTPCGSAQTGNVSGHDDGDDDQPGEPAGEPEAAESGGQPDANYAAPAAWQDTDISFQDRLANNYEDSVGYHRFQRDPTLASLVEACLIKHLSGTSGMYCICICQKQIGAVPLPRDSSSSLCPKSTGTACCPRHV